MSKTKSDLMSDPLITNEALALAVREEAMVKDMDYIFERASIIAAEKEVQQESNNVLPRNVSV